MRANGSLDIELSILRRTRALSMYGRTEAPLNADVNRRVPSFSVGQTEDLADATGRTVSLDTLHDTRRAREVRTPLRC